MQDEGNWNRSCWLRGRAGDGAILLELLDRLTPTIAELTHYHVVVANAVEPRARNTAANRTLVSNLSFMIFSLQGAIVAGCKCLFSFQPVLPPASRPLFGVLLLYSCGTEQEIPSVFRFAWLERGNWAELPRSLRGATVCLFRFEVNARRVTCA